MLTRRILRIRAMQDLYTYFINKRSADATLKEELVIQKKCNEKHCEREKDIYGDIFVKDCKSTIGEEKHFLDTINTLNYNLHNGLNQQGKCIYNNYYNIIYLLVKWVDVSKTQLNTVKVYQKYYKSSNVEIFVNNKILNDIANSNFFTKEVLSSKLLFSENDIKIWYNTYIKKDKFFIKYCSPNTQITDFEIIEYFIKNRILDNGSINIFFVENDSIWEDTIFIIRKMLLETINFFQTETKKEIQFKIDIVNKPEKDFYKNLVTSIEKNWNHIIDLILPKLQNWDLKRIFLIDKILMAMAINEIKYLNIPAAIAIDEYIEIAKIYSTDKSSKFINGIANEISSK